MASSTAFRDSCVTCIEAPADWTAQQHGRRLLCILCEDKSEWLFSYARNLALDAMQDHTELQPIEGWPLKPLQDAFKAMPDARWHDNRRRLVEVTQSSVAQLRDLQVLGMGTAREKRERAGNLAFAAAAFALQGEAALPDPSGDGEFPALVARVRQLLLVPCADSSSSSSVVVMEVEEPRHGEAPAAGASQAKKRSLPLPRSHGSEDEPKELETVEAPPKRTFRPTVPYEPAAEFDAEGKQVAPTTGPDSRRASYCAYVTGLPQCANTRLLKEHFSRFGVLLAVELDGSSTSATVTFRGPAAWRYALRSEHTILNKVVRVSAEAGSIASGE